LFSALNIKTGEGGYKRKKAVKTDSGSSVSAGIYIARLKAGEIRATGKLVLVK